MLYAAAEKILKETDFGTSVDLDDLVNIGWLLCLRRRPKERLKGCFTTLYRCMKKEWFELVQDHSVFIHKKYFKCAKQTPIEDMRNPEEFNHFQIKDNPMDINLEVESIFSSGVNPKHLQVLYYTYLEEKSNSEVATLLKCPLRYIPLLKWEAIAATQQALHINVKGI